MVDKPAIQYVVEEAAAAGLSDVLMVTGRNKRALEDHFDRDHELESALTRGDADRLAGAVQRPGDLHDVRRDPRSRPRGAARGPARGSPSRAPRRDLSRPRPAPSRGGPGRAARVALWGRPADPPLRLAPSPRRVVGRHRSRGEARAADAPAISRSSAATSWTPPSSKLRTRARRGDEIQLTERSSSSPTTRRPAARCTVSSSRGAATTPAIGATICVPSCDSRRTCGSGPGLPAGCVVWSLRSAGNKAGLTRHARPRSLDPRRVYIRACP